MDDHFKNRRERFFVETQAQMIVIHAELKRAKRISPLLH